MIIFKVKKEVIEVAQGKKLIIKKTESDVNLEIFKILRSEIENEIAKLTIEKGLEYVTNKRKIGEMINEITNRLKSAHPMLITKVDVKSLRKLIANLIILNMSKIKK